MDLKMIPWDDMQGYANSSSYDVMCEAQARLTTRQWLERFDEARAAADEDFRFEYQRFKNIIEEMREAVKE